MLNITRLHNRTFTMPSVDTDTRQYYWCKHKGMDGAPENPPNGMPEVRPSWNAPSIPFTEQLQRLSYEVMISQNHSITSKQWRAVMSGDRWATNENGWDNHNKPDDLRADYVNGIDLGSPLPLLMKAVIMGGSLYQGVVEGDVLAMYPGVHAVDANNPVSVEEVLRNKWYFYLVSWHDNMTISAFPQGNGGDVVFPYILKERVEYPLSWFAPWKGGTVNPYIYYKGL